MYEYVTLPYAEITTRLQRRRSTSASLPLPPPPTPHLLGFYTITRINPLFVDDRDEKYAKSTSTTAIRWRSTADEIDWRYSSGHGLGNGNMIAAYATKRNCHFVPRSTLLVTVQPTAYGGRRECRCRCRCQSQRRCRRRHCNTDVRKQRILSILCERYKKTPYQCDAILLLRSRDGINDDDDDDEDDECSRNGNARLTASVTPPTHLRESRCCSHRIDDERVIVKNNSLRSSCSISMISSSCISSYSSASRSALSFASRSQSPSACFCLSSLIVDRLPAAPAPAPAPRPPISSAAKLSDAGLVAFARLRPLLQQPPVRPPIAVVYGRVRYQLQRCARVRTSIVDWYEKSRQTIIPPPPSPLPSPPSPSSASPNCVDLQLDYAYAGWPDFTLDVQQAEKVVKTIRSRKKQRRWCRIITCFAGFAILLLSVMLFSMLLTRGEKLFGPL